MPTISHLPDRRNSLVRGSFTRRMYRLTTPDNGASACPLFDIIFGTFAYPREISNQVGFYDGGSKRVGAMRAGRLVT